LTLPLSTIVIYVLEVLTLPLSTIFRLEF